MSDTHPSGYIPEDIKRESKTTLNWARRNRDLILGGAVLVLALKNRKLKKEQVMLLLRNRDLVAENGALMSLVRAAGGMDRTS